MKRLISSLLIALSLTAAPALAQEPGRFGRGEPDRGFEGPRSGRLAPLPRVLEMISARTPGRHLNTTQGDAGGGPAYFVQWQLPNGRVVVFVVDAASGQVIGRQGG